MSLRKLARVAAGVALFVPFATCADLTGPSGGRGVRVPIVPTFSPAATFAKALYAAAGIQFDRVRVLIVRGETEVLKDTTVAFSPSSADLTLPLTITANPGEVVTATLEYRSADIVLYSGSQSVTTVATGSTPTTPATPLVLIPVGPGSSASTVEISPTSGSFPTSAPVPFSATAFTPEHTTIANAIFGWTVEDASIATVNPQGVVQPTSKGGVAKIRATTLNGKFAEATVTFVTPPASLAIQSGGGQSAMALDALAAPVVVKVLDANGVPVPGATVTFAVATGGGSVTVVNGVSNASGLASANWTLGATVGTQAITATATALPNAPITINATATERPAKTLAFGQQPTKTAMNAAITPAVTVKALDDKGNVVAGYTGAVTIALDANPNSSTLGGTLTVNAVAGVASFANLTLNKSGGGNTFKATATGLTAVASDAFTIDQVPAGLSLNAGGSQTAPVNSTLSQIVVKVADANGNGVAGATVTFAVATGGGSIVVNNGTTDVDGLARATWTLGSAVGAQSITATSGTLAGSPLTITATGTQLAAVALSFAQQPSNTAVNGTITPAVTVRAIDAVGNTVTGFTGAVALAFETAGGATLGGTTSVNAVAGIATFSNLSVNTVGSYHLTAASGSLTSALSSAFVIAPPPPVALQFLVQPSNTPVDSVIKPAVQVKIVDVNGATVISATNAITIDFNGTPNASLHGTKTVIAVNGVATFSDLAVVPIIAGVKLQATATGLTTAVSNSFDATPPPAAARTWTGALSTKWDNPGNWSPAGVPVATDSVTIVAGPANQPVVDAAAEATAILVETGASLLVDRIDLQALFYTARVYNKGTLRLSAAYLYTAAIENRGAMLVDSIAIVNSISNIGPLSSLQLKSSASNGSLLEVVTTLTNEGTIELTDVDEEGAQLAVLDSLVNKAGATINVKDGAGGGRAIYGILRNYGSLNISSSGGLQLGFAQPASTVEFLNAGSINATGASNVDLFLYDTLSVFRNTGSIVMGTGDWTSSGGKLNLHTATGTVAGSGTFRALSAALDIDFSKFSMPLHVDGITRFAGDSLNVPTGQTLKLAGGAITQPAAIHGTLRHLQVFDQVALNGGARIHSGGKLQVNGDVFVDGTFVIASGGTLDLNATDNDVTFSVYNPFTNSGQIQMSSTNGPYGPTLLVEAGTRTVTNALGATIGAYGGAGGRRLIAGVLDNKGTVYVEHDSFLSLQGPGTHANSGTIDLANASLPTIPGPENLKSFNFDSGDNGAIMNSTGTINIGSNRTFFVQDGDNLITSGTVAGKGTMEISPDGAFTNSGTFAPGGVGTIGTMTFKGGFNVGSGSVDIDVANQGSSDLLQVTGTASMNGKINVNAVAGFVGPISDLLVISGSPCLGSPNIQPSASWGGYNDGCFRIYSLGFGPIAAIGDARKSISQVQIPRFTRDDR